MLSFESDYIEGCHEKILEALAKTNMDQQTGYGFDIYSKRAKEKIAAACECPDADIYFLVGGTQTNQLAIDAMLAPYEGVIAAESGHVSVHEAGAIEYTGHKVLTVRQHDGKIDADELEAYIEQFESDGNREHMVFPGMVYISHPTESGTLYTAEELTEISKICHENGMTLYMDGARLGYGLAAHGTDVTLPMIADLCDAFYIGGTKVGALCGEALVFTHGNTPKHFFTRIKQHGALLAKGRLIGIQFDTLFTDGLYLEISRNAIESAERLKEIFLRHGYEFAIESPTNQQFIILEDTEMAELSKHVSFSFWEKYNENHTVVRFATSWATTKENLDELDTILSSL